MDYIYWITCMCVYVCDLHMSNNNCIDVHTLMYIKYDKICTYAYELSSLDISLLYACIHTYVSMLTYM